MTILINTLKSSQRILRAKHSGLRKEIDFKTNCYQILNLVTNQRLEIITTLLQNPVSRWGFPLMSVMSIIVGHSQQRHFFFFSGNWTNAILWRKNVLILSWQSKIYIRERPMPLSISWDYSLQFIINKTINAKIFLIIGNI